MGYKKRNTKYFSNRLREIFNKLVKQSKDYCELAFRWTLLVMKKLFSESSFSGLWPAVLLAIVAWIQLSSTNEQVNLLREQLFLEKYPELTLVSKPCDDIRMSLYLANIGNQTAKNVNLNVRLLLVTDSQIFSWDDTRKHHPSFLETNNPRETINPRFSIKQDTSYNISYLVDFTTYLPFPFLLKLSQKQYQYILSDVREFFNGRFVIWIDYSYRRESDWKISADTFMLDYTPSWGAWDDIRERVGGDGLAKRITDYIVNGPEYSMDIYSDRIVMYKYILNRPRVYADFYYKAKIWHPNRLKRIYDRDWCIPE